MKKRQKSKMTMLIVGGLAAVSLVSVGFAGWVVTTEHGTANDNVTVEVGAVTNNSTSIVINKSSSDLNLKFDNVPNPSGDIFDKNQGGSEKMEFHINFTITGNTSAYTKVNFAFSGALTDGKYDNYLKRPYSTSSNTITYNLSWSPSATIASASNQIVTPNNTSTISVSGNATTITAYFKFEWGSYFKGKNPGNLDTSKDVVTKADIIRYTEELNTKITDDLAKVDTTPLLKVTIQAAA